MQKHIIGAHIIKMEHIAKRKYKCVDYSCACAEYKL